MKPLGAILLIGLPLLGKAQLESATRLVLTGPDPEQRQVEGLAYPSSGDAAVSVDAARNQASTFVEVDGSAVLEGDLSPAPSEYTAGMVVTMVLTQSNSGAATVNLNGLGPRSLLKHGRLPLDSADLAPGVPVRMAYDGEAFRVLSSTYLPCRKGYSIGAREYCIEDSSRADTTFLAALQLCRSKDARLCTYAEWVHACQSNPGFIGTVLDYEWVDSAANNANGAKLVGNGGDGTPGSPVGINCGHGGQASISNGRGRYRCCTHR